MNKKIYALITLFAIMVAFASCGNDDNEEEYKRTLAWKELNDKIYDDAAATGEYRKLLSGTGNGEVLYKTSSVIVSPRLIEITDTPPLFTDSVVCRYIGWYFDENLEKVTFDSTESEDGNNGGLGTGFRVNGVVPGWTDILQTMNIGDEREICLPYMLGYGSAGLTSGTTTIIPAYTTLFFNIKLLKVYRKQTSADN